MRVVLLIEVRPRDIGRIRENLLSLPGVERVTTTLGGYSERTINFVVYARGKTKKEVFDLKDNLIPGITAIDEISGNPVPIANHVAILPILDDLENLVPSPLGTPPKYLH